MILVEVYCIFDSILFFQQAQAEQEAAEKFKFELEKRPLKLDKITKEVEETRQKELQFDNNYYRPPPNFEEAAEIRLNVAAILREDKQLQKKQLEEAKRIKDLEWNLRDSAEFENWKEEQRYREKLEDIEHQQRKKYEMELAREAGIKAAEEKKHINKRTAHGMKQISKEKESERQKKKQQDAQEKQVLIQTVLETRENAGLEMKKIKEKNKQVHDQNKKELEIQIQKKKEEDEVERKKREDLIRQIKEAERQPKTRTKGYDPTETMGIGLLEEMSLVQLRERLCEVKIIREAEKEQTRQTNLKVKDEKLSSLQSKVQAIKENRDQLKQSNKEDREKRQRKAAEEEKRIQEIKEEQILEVHEIIVEKKRAKKREEDRLAKEYREIQLKRMYMNANNAIVEELQWKGQEEGAEREIKWRQNKKLIEQEQIQGVKYGERKILADDAKKEIKSKLDFITEYDSTLQKANKENEVLFRQIREDRKLQHQTIRDYEAEHNKNMLDRDTFKYKISDMSLSNAKSRLEASKSKKNKTGKKHSDNEDLHLPGPKYDSNNVINESHHEDEG